MRTLASADAFVPRGDTQNWLGSAGAGIDDRAAPPGVVSHRAATIHITKLVDAGLLMEIPASGRVRRFIAREILAVVNGEASSTDSPKLAPTTKGHLGA